MKTIVHVSQKPNKKTVLLYFGEKGSTNKDTWGATEYLIRGGICFPFMHETDFSSKEVSGFAVLCGRDESTGAMTIFEQNKFVVISDIIDPVTNKIDHEGLAPFLTSCWSRYLCKTFFYQQSESLLTDCRRDIRREGLIEPKPIFVETESNLQDAIHQIWVMAETKRLIYERDSEIDKALSRHGIGVKDLKPAMHSLACAVAGMDIYTRG